MLAEEKRAHIDVWKASGLTKSAYARAHELNIKTFGRWCRLAHMASSPKPKLLPVAVSSSEGSKSPGSIRLIYGSGALLELPSSTSPDWLGALLKCLV